MKVLVTGATGLVGRALVEALRARGDDVVVVGRSAEKLRDAYPDGVEHHEWDPNTGPIDASVLEGVDGVVNLAGEPVHKGRWTKEKKARIRDSRVVGTRNLVEGMSGSVAKPKVLVNASAIGYYGDARHRALTETSFPQTRDFLQEVCEEWEAAARKARDDGVRVGIVRIGIVLSKEGGAYPLMSLPYRLFVGGPIGLGKRWMSWVHIDDVVGTIVHLLDTETADGVFNATAPNPVSNSQWSRTLASVLKRPNLFMVPPPALKLALGGFADVVLTSARVYPSRTQASGYEFRYEELRPALEALEGRAPAKVVEPPVPAA